MGQHHSTQISILLAFMLALTPVATGCDGFSLDGLFGGDEAASNDSDKPDEKDDPEKDDEPKDDDSDKTDSDDTDKSDDDDKTAKKDDEPKDDEKKADPRMPDGKASDKVDDRPTEVLKPKLENASSIGNLLQGATQLTVTENNIPFKSLKLAQAEFTITDPQTIQAFTDEISKQARLVPECPKCMTTIVVRAQSSNRELASMDFFCGGAVDTPVLINTLTHQCWVLDDASETKKILENASQP